ncbi:uncharacterized protein LOC131018980 [Salvia miltiorrhiza]|uniref:uncharacterized protein LOC131018980 n=1 Tax=Salvia miltiorrhiza TaxID=226208 RepID=UPI0025AB7AF4|nr:uncharacterized protein LOC131018980 [Salvia miltiorrhiza]
MGEFLKRSESVRIKCRATDEDILLNLSKKRKVFSKLENDSCGEEELAENSVLPAVSRTSSCSKHENSSDVVKMSLSSPDLENAGSHSEGFETEISTSTGLVFSREATPTSELYGDSEHVLLQQSPFDALTVKSLISPSSPELLTAHIVDGTRRNQQELDSYVSETNGTSNKRTP